MAEGQDFWVFGYGSLMWNPGFEVEERVLAELAGYRRAFCMRSVVYRGTPEAPGLVLALDAADTSCRGVAYRVTAARSAETLDYLRDRELVSSAYLEALEWLQFDDGRREQALVYVINRAHDQYCGHIAPEEQAEIIARASGPAGTNRDYLFNTVQALEGLEIEDKPLQSLAEAVRMRG